MRKFNWLHMMGVLIVVYCAGSAFAQARAPIKRTAAVRLMFGKETQQTPRTKFMDFAYVTPSAKLDAGKPWGWVETKKVTAWVFDNDRGCSIPLDGMLEHCVTCWDGTFGVRVPRGRVAVHVWIGDMFKGLRRTMGSFRVRAEGKMVIDERVTFKTLCTERWWLRGMSEVYRKDVDRWARQAKPVLDEYDFTVDVTDGVLDLQMTKVNLCAMVVVPGADAARMKAILSKIEQERRKEFDKRYPWKPQPDEPMPPVRDLDRQRAFIVFQKNIDDQVCPWTRPTEDEARDVIRAFAAQGEQEPFRFGVLPLEMLRAFSVEVGDFTGPAGAKIETAKHADLWTERYAERGCRACSPLTCACPRTPRRASIARP